MCNAPVRSLLVTLLALSASLAACDRPPAARPEASSPAAANIFLLTVDTLRADHLGCYGYQRSTSPNLDALAEAGVRFDQASAQWPKTAPSFASLFTSTYPSDNGIVRKVGLELPCNFMMLAETLRRRGYSTHAVVANAALAREFYFDQGFDTYIETWKIENASASSDPNGAEAVTRLATAVAGNIDRSKPYFLWVHYLDPHFPYDPPEDWKGRFVDDEYFDPSRRISISDRPRQEMGAIGTQQVLDGRDEHAFYVARYDEEIAYADAKIGELLENLETQGLMENTVTVFTSDHGESLGEHQYYFDHGRFGFETCTRVPLIIHYPQNFEPRVDAAPVELIDLGPTLLELAGVRLPEGRWMQGNSLLQRLRGEGTGSEQGLAFSEAGYATDGRWQRSVRDQRFKMLYARGPRLQRWISGEGVLFTLYDLQNDPMETINVADSHPQDFDRLQRSLLERKEAPRFDVGLDKAACEAVTGVTEETTDLLKSLGYL